MVDGKVYVGDLGDGCAKQELEEKFSKYGQLRNVWVARKPPGFAFVEFEDGRDAEDAVRALDGTRINGSRARVELSSGRSRRGDRGPPRGGGDRGYDDRGGNRDSRRRRSRSHSPRRRSHSDSPRGSPRRRSRSRSRS